MKSLQRNLETFDIQERISLDQLGGLVLIAFGLSVLL
jgi:hypothetical protein